MSVQPENKNPRIWLIALCLCMGLALLGFGLVKMSRKAPTPAPVVETPATYALDPRLEPYRQEMIARIKAKHGLDVFPEFTMELEVGRDGVVKAAEFVKGKETDAAWEIVRGAMDIHYSSLPQWYSNDTCIFRLTARDCRRPGTPIAPDPEPENVST